MFLNICFEKLWVNPKSCSYLIQVEGNNFCFFFSRSFVVKQYVACYLIEVEVSILFSQHHFFVFLVYPKVVPI